MSNNDAKMENLRAFFRRFVETAGGGAFTPITRRRLLRMKGLSGRDRTKNDFWNDVRKRVRNAQTDFQLFVLTADKNQVDQSMTHETLSPMVRTLLDSRNWDLNRAEIARLFIDAGFSYLKATSIMDITLAHDRTITEALDLANYLVAKRGGYRVKGE